jgi:hypothetical protein
MSDLQLVKYQTFINHLETGLVSDVSIYDFSTDVEITYKFNNIAYGTQGSFGSHGDTLLHRTLESTSVEYTLVNEKYQGPEVSSNKFPEYTGAFLIAVPVLLVAVVLVQALVIKKLTTKSSNESSGT